MSQIKGGRADKIGNAFERLWIVRLALDVVKGSATSIKWEPLGPEGAGVECVLVRPDGTREKHQCKVENGTAAKWSAADLGDVLEAAKTHLEADPFAKFTFVSKDPARVPSDLADRARSCDNNAKDFLAHCLSSDAHKRNYQSLCSHWALNSTEGADTPVAIGLLSRMNFERGFWEPYEKQLLYQLAESIAEGEGKRIVRYLGAYLEEALGNTCHSDDLRNVLRDQSIPPLNLAGDPRVPEGIERLQARFRSALEPYLICHEVLSRPEPERLLEHLCADGGARLIFVTGDAGSGKSGVLFDTVRLLDEQRVPYLPIRLDMHFPDKSVRAYSKERLELPASPGECLSALADRRRAVLIIDQLDAVRWTSANSDLSWELSKEIIDEALRFPNISVVVAGRTIDLDDDLRINHWKKEKEKGKAVEVVPFGVTRLSGNVVESIVTRYGVSYESLLPKEKELLSNAQSLQLWWRLAEDGKVGTFSIRATLLGSFWGHYRDKAIREFPNVTSDTLNNLLDQLVEFMDSQGRLDAPNALLENHRATTEALRGLAILNRTNGTSRFAHQSHLDYLTIERVFQRALQGKENPIEWLRSHDQSLFRRDQVRFLLQLLRDQDHKLYLEFLKDIFFEEGVRFHIQHLALTTLAQADHPTDGEHELIKQLWKKEMWHAHVLEQVLAAHAPWLNRFTEDGTIPAMLESEEEGPRNEALSLCCRSAETAPEWFECVLAPYWDSGDPKWTELIGPWLAHNAEHLTQTVFEWRLARTRTGADQLEIYYAEQLAKKDQTRAISFLAAIAEGLVSNVLKYSAGGTLQRVRVDNERFLHLLDACESHPRLAWDTLFPVHKRVAKVEERLRTEPFSVTTHKAGDYALQVISALHDFLLASGAALLQKNGKSFLAELSSIEQPVTTAHSRRLAVDVFATAHKGLADEATDCFLVVENPLDIDVSSEFIGNGDWISPQDPAIGFLRAQAGSCSPSLFQRIEKEILAFHADYEKQDVKRQLERIQNGNWNGNPNLYGLPQYELLLALPVDRLSENGARTLHSWQGKFGRLEKYRRKNQLMEHPAVSPIPPDKAKYVSDGNWLDIVNEGWAGSRNKCRETKDGKLIEATPSNFASSLEIAGRLNPGRYVRLALQFPANANECYYFALLRVAGMATAPSEADDSWEPTSVADIEALIAHLDNKQDTEVAKNICRTMRDRNGEPWSEKTLEFLNKFALHHPNPDGSTWPDSFKSQGDIRSLEMIVLNSVRCSAIRTASQLLWAHPDLLDWAKELAEEVIQDLHPAVRAASFELAYAIGNHDLDLALSLMVRAYEETDDAILSVQYGPHLIRYLWRREAEMTHIFKRALASSNEKTVELAAYWVTIGNTLENIYTDLAYQAFRGPTAARAGVVRALVYISHLHDKHREACLVRLARFLENEEKKVLDAADGIFRRDGFLDVEEAPSFAERFACSAAFLRNPSSLLHQLSEFGGSLVPYANAIEASVARLSGPLLSKTQNFANRHWRAQRDIPTILLRLYQQSEEDKELRSRCLDQWDILLRTRVGTGHDVLAKMDS
ncbi:MAG: hypothetical protein DWQ01_08895 [Planctomycetota bacterium]|nr:MAG: hypothetical protein DWQ01_08895 [Planctomycetota bacterium]